MNLDQTMIHVQMFSQLAIDAQAVGGLPICGYGQIPENAKDLIPKVKRFQISDTSGMMDFIRSICNDKHRNVYIPTCTTADAPDKPLKPTSKGFNVNVEKMLAIVCDIDEPDIEKHLSPLPVRPNYILQTSEKCYQAFFIPNKALTREEGYRIAVHFEKLSSSDFCTKDMCHVWRLPGLPNWPNKTKVDAGRSKIPQLVTVYQPWDGSRFDPDDIKIPEPVPVPKIQPIDKSDLTWNADASPPMNKFMLLRDNIPEFCASWDLKRNFPKKDGSHDVSRYDLSLCYYAARTGWSQQEMLNLIFMFRREYNFDSLINNKQKHLKTIAKALESVTQEGAGNTLNTGYILRGTPHKLSKAETLEAISVKLGIKIIRIKKYVKDHPAYELETEKGAVRLDRIDDLISPSVLRKNLAAHTGVYMKYANKTWPPIAQQLLDCCEEIHVDDEATVKTRIHVWLAEYLSDFSKLSLEQVLENDDAEPFYKQGHWFINLEDFTSWAYRIKHSRQGPRKLALELIQCGFKSEKFDIMPGFNIGSEVVDKKTSRRFWRVTYI